MPTLDLAVPPPPFPQCYKPSYACTYEYTFVAQTVFERGVSESVMATSFKIRGEISGSGAGSSAGDSSGSPLIIIHHCPMLVCYHLLGSTLTVTTLSRPPSVRCALFRSDVALGLLQCKAVVT